ncbi:MAG TPA: copper ion binding protein, partial [Burkholderiaceae bacterium]|nr:copper ion binding protein [Burkholderiaceae bacterium]
MDDSRTATMPEGTPAPAPERIVLPVQGMTCASCVAHVEKALAKVPGVTHVAVNLATESAAVEGHALEPRSLVHAVDAAGYAVPLQTVRLEIEGMTCATCVARLEKALRAVPGVSNVGVNLASESAQVELVAGAATVRDLIQAVTAAGYSAT